VATERLGLRDGTFTISPSGIIETTFGLSDATALSSSEAAGNRSFDPLSSSDFYSYRSRRDRHALFRALNENTAYLSQVHPWADVLKTLNGMHPDAKPVFGIFSRIVEFWANHTYCGEIDEDAGDGTVVYSAMPFRCKDEGVRPAIARVLKESRFALYCHTMARIGAMTGEVGLMAVNDRVNRRTHLEVIDPESVIQYVADPTGTCLAYRIVEWRDDPRPGNEHMPQVPYREDAELQYDRDGRPYGCRFRTFLWDEPFAWEENGPRAEWVERYPFVPFVLIPHIRMSPKFPYGHSEGHNALVKILGLDDMASRFANQVATAVDPIYLMAGVDPPAEDEDPVVETSAGLDASGNDVKYPAVYAGPEAKAQPLLSSLDLSHVDIHLQRRIDKLEDEYPELRKDIQNATGDASGKALRAAMMKLFTKAVVRRTGYDRAVADCIKFCIRMAGIYQYDGFADFGAPAVEANPKLLDFAIDGSRPVFRQAPEDRLDVEKMEMANVESADRAGIPPTLYLEMVGKKELVPRLIKAQDAYLERNLEVGRSKQQAPPANDVAAQAIQSKGGAKGLATGNGGGKKRIVAKVGAKPSTNGTA
jgi:hypothetical protein